MGPPRSRVKESVGKKQGSAPSGTATPTWPGSWAETAVAAAKADTFLGERYRRIARRRGKKKAIVALGRSILIIIWHLLNDPQARFHLGPEFYDNRTGLERKKRIHFRQLEALGYKVTLEPAAGRRFARRAAIRDGQVVVLCTVPGWLSD